MSTSWVLFVTTPSSATDVVRIADSYRAARTDLDPECRVVSGDEVGESDWRGSLGVILSGQDDVPPFIRRLEDRIGFDSMTTLIRLGGSKRSDAISLPTDPGSTSLMAVIRTLAHRQPEFERVQNELAVTTRIAEGVQDEIGRIDQELQMASLVQREFLPREISVDCGVTVAALWRPASYVSGDIYDIIKLDDDHVGLFLADAVGHGVPAALLTMVICRSLNGVDIGPDGEHRVVPPGEALGRLNRFMMSRKGETTRFATATYVVFNHRTSTARIASAGHPSVVRIGKPESGSPNQEFAATGGLLGVFDDEVFHEHEVVLENGEGLILHSDGFEQAFPDCARDHHHRRLPNHRYRDVIQRLANLDHPPSMIAEIEDMLDRHTGSLHQSDDLTMICMRRDAVVADARTVQPDTIHQVH